ncbi:MAG TPA: hypothetical protein DEB31_04220 [Clostridiales bacterium]|nr:hypothetical protein [Clostridiales bacterium]
MISVDVAQAIRKPGVPYEFSYDGTPGFEGISFLEPLVLRAAYSGIEGGVRFRGTFHAAVAATCTRCLADVKYPVHCAFEELFVRGQDEDGDSYTFCGETVNLDKMVYDMTVLAIPQQVLCKPDCAGLCGKCGADLNGGSCVCEENTADENNPFAVLKDLK